MHDCMLSMRLAQCRVFTWGNDRSLRYPALTSGRLQNASLRVSQRAAEVNDPSQGLTFSLRDILVKAERQLT
jgi:hypothetical protein